MFERCSQISIGLVYVFMIGFGNVRFLVERNSLDCDIETPIKDKGKKKQDGMYWGGEKQEAIRSRKAHSL